MGGLIEAAMANPWTALDRIVDGPLHPGGHESTEALLDRAGVGDGTCLVDAGCGPGDALALAADRGATTVGIDRDPPDCGVRGDLASLPVRTGSVDVVLAECVMCLVPDRTLAFDEVRRVLAPGGRLALSDMVVADDVPPVPAPVAETLCLSQATDRDTFVRTIEQSGFAVEDVRDHRDDLLAMRDDIASKVDYEALLATMGERGQTLLDRIDSLERAVESGRISYISLVAHAES
ncbi:MAG: methyltransferase domain-containing protein [Halovenus sp.]